VESLSAEIIWELARRAAALDETGNRFCDDLFTKYAINPAPQSDYLPYYRFLHLVAGELKPELVVELGVQRGVATAHLAAGYKDTLVIGIDVAFDPISSQVEAEFGYQVLYIIGDSTQVANRVKPAGEIEVLFIDSHHTADHVRKELAAYTPLLADEALVLFDNLYHPHHAGQKQVYEAFYEFPHLRLELTSELCPAWGFGAAIYRR